MLFRSLRGGTFFQPGIHLEHFFKGCEIISETFKGSEKSTENLRDLKILDVAQFKGCEILLEYSVKAFEVKTLKGYA